MKQPLNQEDNCARPPKGRSGAAFLLAQVGAHAASKFAERLAELQLIPAHAGILRMLAATPAITQQALATALRTLPSRLVALIDELESKGLLERRAHESDRRRYALHVTEEGKSTLQAIGRVAREHQQSLLAALSEEDQAVLADLLQRVADQQGLTKGVHPGYGSAERPERSGARPSRGAQERRFRGDPRAGHRSK
jgi:DNA-binding MarR family transcriptional regulator